MCSFDDGDGTEYERKLAARKKAFLEDSPVIRKSFSGGLFIHIATNMNQM